MGHCCVRSSLPFVGFYPLRARSVPIHSRSHPQRIRNRMGDSAVSVFAVHVGAVDQETFVQCYYYYEYFYYDV